MQKRNPNHARVAVWCATDYSTFMEFRSALAAASLMTLSPHRISHAQELQRAEPAPTAKKSSGAKSASRSETSPTPSPIPGQAPSFKPQEIPDDYVTKPKPSPVPSETPSVASDDEQPAQPEHVSEHVKGLLLDNWRIGPVFQLGFPHVLNAAVDGHYLDSFSLGINGGYLAFGWKNFNVGMWNADLRARWYPGHNAFFFGMAGGYQRFFVNAGKSIDFLVVKYAVPLDVQYRINTWYVIPHVGLEKVFDSGFLIGAELGWQINLVTSSTFEVQSVPGVEQVQADPEYQRIKADLENTGNKIGSFSPPYFTLIKIGWLF